MTRILALIPLIFLLQACNTLITSRSEITPEESQLLYTQALQAYRNGDMQRAETNLTKLSGYQPDNANVWFRLGNVYARTGNNESAVMAYRKALAIEPSLSKAWHNLAVTQLRQASGSLVSLIERSSQSDPLQSHARQMHSKISDILSHQPATRSDNVKSDQQHPPVPVP